MDKIESEKFAEENGYSSIVDNLSKNYSINSKKDKILLVGHSCNFGGAEILFKHLIQEFLKQDVEVIVLVKTDGVLREEYEKYAPTFIINTFEEFEYYIKELKKYGYCNAILNTVLCGDLIPLLHKWDYYVMSLVHELPGMIKSLNAEFHARTIANKANLTVFPSLYVEKKFETLYKVQSEKLIQPQGLYNRYDKFDKMESRKEIEERYNIPNENHIILNVGRGEYRKGFDLFIEAYKKLKNEGYSFIWVGEVNDEMQEYLNELDADNLILTGFISDLNQIMSFYDACDVFMLTSREDPFPSVVLEAFNAKRPVVAFENAGGFSDIVLNNKTGILVEFESVDDLINNVKLICDDTYLKETLGNNAKAMSDQYSFSNYVKLLKVYLFKGQEVSFLENELISKMDTIEYLENDITSKINKLNYLKNKNQQLSKEKNEISSIKNDEILKLKQKNKKLSKEKKELLSSSSWKVTKPLRQVKNEAKIALKFKNKVKSIVKPKKTENIDSSIKTKKSIKKQKRKNKFSLVHHYPGFYKTYIINENINRVNLFIDQIDNSVFKLKYLFPFILEYCNKYKYSLRIIYRSADFDNFKIFLDAYKIPKNFTIINLKEDNYLDIGLNEKFVCTCWKDAKCLMNTPSINTTIYYYLDDLRSCNDLDFYRISNICYQNNIVILNDDLSKLKNLKNFIYDIDVEINKKMNSNNKILCCDFGDMVDEGIELLNYLFLNNILDFNLWSVFIGSKDNISMIYSDFNNSINNNSNKLDIDLFLKFDYDKQNLQVNDENVIRIIIKKVNDKNYNVLDITDFDEVNSFDKFIFSKGNQSDHILQISKIIKNIDGVN